MSEEQTPWFRARRYGYGAGLPITRQGWALILVYGLTLIGIGRLAKMDHGLPRIAAFALFLIITPIVMIIAARRTRGGWTWRWGSDAQPVPHQASARAANRRSAPDDAPLE
jgi:hypothetical protein